jgi:hypothetical protein
MKEKFSANINCSYKDDGENLYVDFNYNDCNGVAVSSKKRGKDVEKITASIINDIVVAMAKSKEQKQKNPEDMTKEELLEALKLMEKEANEQRTKNQLLEKRLQARSASLEEEKARNEADLIKEYNKVIGRFYKPF